MPPTREALAAAFSAKAGEAVAKYGALVLDWIDRLIEDGKVPNYSYVSTVATMANYAYGTWADKRNLAQASACAQCYLLLLHQQAKTGHRSKKGARHAI
ncbi:MAG: hypothetical protein IKF78_10785 [Atopobiaceae bacterium]|nr:hypothetical protein [Atopobiaceae bacterium]